MDTIASAQYLGEKALVKIWRKETWLMHKCQNNPEQTTKLITRNKVKWEHIQKDAQRSS